MLLSSTSDILQVISASAVTLDVLACYRDYNKGFEMPGRQATAITAAATIDILTMPGSGGVNRCVELLTIRNKHASSSNLITVQISTGGVVYQIYKTTLNAGETLQYVAGLGFAIAPASVVLAAPVEALTATKVLVAADSGKLLTLGTATGFNTALPAPAAGLNFTFVVKVAPTTAYTITTNGTTQNIIHGQVYTGDVNSAIDPDLTNGTAVDVITLVANKAVIGDRVELICDGTLWYAKAFATVFDGITLD